jgi:hypothetical protein
MAWSWRLRKTARELRQIEIRSVKVARTMTPFSCDEASDGRLNLGRVPSYPPGTSGLDPAQLLTGAYGGRLAA